MFNKPNLFPKASESAAARTVQPVGAQQGVQARSGGATGANVYSNAATSAERDATRGEQQGDSRLIVGPSVKLKGAEILDCQTLVVEGFVAATMNSRVLRIAAGGIFEGTVSVDVAEIQGRFDGELTAREQLIVRSGGEVSGKIRYGKILIEEGGQISGDIQAEAKGAHSSASKVETSSLAENKSDAAVV